MRRNWFFFLERLNITPGERHLVLSLASIAVILTMLLMVVHPRSPYNPSFYASQVRLFQNKIAIAEKFDSIQKAPYYHLKALNAKLKKDTERSLTGGKKGETATKQSIPLVNINTAGVDSLVFLPGIGPKTAKKIVDYRKTNGKFPSLDSIKKVKGIGDKKLANITPYIRLK